MWYAQILVLHAANNTLATAQSVAELLGRVKYPNIGLILLGRVGHMGFSALRPTITSA
jgi:hypothetical protein